jgi:hypothetical protein
MTLITAQRVIMGMAIWFPFGGLSKLETEPLGGGMVGPFRSMACRGKRVYAIFSAVEKGIRQVRITVSTDENLRPEF